jgi:nitrogen fixation/metabolism regulation signal transduction histidine kinase
MEQIDPDPDQTPEREPARLQLFSTPGKLAALFAGGLLLFSALIVAGRRFAPIPEWVIWLSAFGLTLVPVVWIAGRFVGRLVRTLEGLSSGIRSFQDRDFSMRIPYRRNDELGELVRLYNRVGELLQEERAQIRQRELLLQSALDQSPIAIVLVNPLQRVVYDNAEARRLFMGGSKLGGRQFEEILAGCPNEMRQVLVSDSDGIFTVETEGELETDHLARREFFLNRRKHALYLLCHMTAELARQEVEIWKKVIRIISHELNNSLAPISSLAHSGAPIAQQPDKIDRLEPIYVSIRERVEHLTSFLEGYARFARLPKPKKQVVEWSAWLAGPRKMYGFETPGGEAVGARLVRSVPAPAGADQPVAERRRGQ